jgi:hypothetical protein
MHENFLLLCKIFTHAKKTYSIISNVAGMMLLILIHGGDADWRIRQWPEVYSAWNKGWPYVLKCSYEERGTTVLCKKKLKALVKTGWQYGSGYSSLSSLWGPS